MRCFSAMCLLRHAGQRSLSPARRTNNAIAPNNVDITAPVPNTTRQVEADAGVDASSATVLAPTVPFPTATVQPPVADGDRAIQKPVPAKQKKIIAALTALTV